MSGQFDAEEARSMADRIRKEKDAKAKAEAEAKAKAEREALIQRCEEGGRSAIRQRIQEVVARGGFTARFDPVPDADAGRQDLGFATLALLESARRELIADGYHVRPVRGSVYKGGGDGWVDCTCWEITWDKAYVNNEDPSAPMLQPSSQTSQPSSQGRGCSLVTSALLVLLTAFGLLLRRLPW